MKLVSEVKPVSEESGLPSSSSSSVVKSNYKSEVWDIELDVEQSVVDHGKSSKAPSASIVVNCKSLSWGAKMDQDTIIDERTEVLQEARPLTSLSAGHSSLAPSQSASQLPIKVAALDSGMISRFFGQDLKGNPDADRVEQRKGLQASPPQATAPRSPSPPKHAIVSNQEETSRESTERRAAHDPDKLAISYPTEVEDQELETLTPCQDDLDDVKTFDQDPLDLLEDLNNGHLLAYSGSPDAQFRFTQPVLDFQEARDTWLCEHDGFFPPQPNIPSDFLGLVDDAPTLHYLPDSCPSDGNHSGSFDMQDYANEDTTLAYDYYIAEDDPQYFDTFHVLDSSGDLPANAWFGAQTSDEDFRREIMHADTMEEEHVYDEGVTATSEEYVDSVMHDDCEASDASEPFFSQGRALLLGVDLGSKEKETARDIDKVKLGDMSDVEKSVARNLRGHWHPVKF